MEINITSLENEKITFQTRLDEEKEKGESSLGEITKISEEHNKINEELKVKNKQISELEKQIKELQNTSNQPLEDLKKEINELKTSLVEAEKQRDEKIEKLNQSESLQKATQNKLTANEKTISELQAQLNDKELELGTVKRLSEGRGKKIEELKYVQEKILALEKQVSELELQKGTGLSADEKDKKIGELREKLLAMKDMVRLAQVDKRELESKLKVSEQNLANQKSELQKENERLKTQIGSTDEETAQFIAEDISKNEIIAQLQKEIEDLNQRIEDYRYMELDEESFISEEELPGNENLSEEELPGNENPPSLSEAEEENLIEMADLKMQISELEKNKEQNTEWIKELVSRKKESEDAVSELEEQLKDKDSELSNIGAEFNYLKDMLDQMTRANKGGEEGQSAEILELKKQVKEKETALSVITSNIHDLENKLQKATQEKGQKARQADENAKQMITLGKQLKEANEKINELNSKLPETKSEGNNSKCKDGENCGEEDSAPEKKSGVSDEKEILPPKKTTKLNELLKSVSSKGAKDIENRKPNEPFVEGILKEDEKKEDQDSGEKKDRKENPVQEEKKQEADKPKKNGVDTLFGENGEVNLPEDEKERQELLNQVGDELGLSDEDVEVTPESVAEAQKALDKEEKTENKKEKVPTIGDVFSEVNNQFEKPDEEKDENT